MIFFKTHRVDFLPPKIHWSREHLPIDKGKGGLQERPKHNTNLHLLPSATHKWDYSKLWATPPHSVHHYRWTTIQTMYLSACVWRLPPDWQLWEAEFASYFFMLNIKQQFRTWHIAAMQNWPDERINDCISCLHYTIGCWRLVYFE